MKYKKGLSISITTFNEEKFIEKVLKNLQNFADEVIIIDGESTDKTVEIAKKYTKNVFVTQNNLNLNVNKQKGIEKCTYEWVLYLDADELVSDELKTEIKNMISSIKKSNDFDGYYIPRKNFVNGKWLRFGALYPDYQLRLFRNGCGKFGVKSIHDFLKVSGKLGYLKGAIKHIGNYRSLHHYVTKMNNYTTNDAKIMLTKKIKFPVLKMITKPIIIFVYQYFFKLGFLNGLYGLTFSVSSAYYEYILYFKYIELLSNNKKRE